MRAIGSPLVVIALMGLGGCELVLDFGALRASDGAVGGDAGMPSCVAPPAGGPYFTTDETHTFTAQPYALAVGDLNGDGLPEIVVSGDDDLVQVYSLVSKGTHTYAQVSYASGCSSGVPKSLAIGLFDDDAFVDVLSMCGDSSTSGASEMALLAGTGNGSLAQTPIPMAHKVVSPQASAAFDLDGDGYTDIVVAGFASSAGIYWGGPGFTAQSPVTFPTGVSSYGVGIGALSGSGAPDLLVSNYGAGSDGSPPVPHGSVTIMRPNTTSGRPVYTASGSLADLGTVYPYGMGLAQIDDSAPLDLVLLSDDTRVPFYLGQSDGTFLSAPSGMPTVPAFQNYLAIGDLDCSGTDDAIVTHFQSGGESPPHDRYEVLVSSHGQLATQIQHDVADATAPAVGQVAIADLDGDGRKDVVMALFVAGSGTSTGGLRILWGSATP